MFLGLENGGKTLIKVIHINRFNLIYPPLFHLTLVEFFSPHDLLSKKEDEGREETTPLGTWVLGKNKQLPLLQFGRISLMGELYVVYRFF